MQDFVPQASTLKEYTPVAADITIGKWITFYLDTDATVSILDMDGNASPTLSLKAGYHPILVKQIISVSAGKVYLMKHRQLG